MSVAQAAEGWPEALGCDSSTPVISALMKQKQKDQKFKVIFAYTVSSRPLGIYETLNQEQSKRLRGWGEIPVGKNTCFVRVKT